MKQNEAKKINTKNSENQRYVHFNQEKDQINSNIQTEE